jgi:hypothetical protein
MKRIVLIGLVIALAVATMMGCAGKGKDLAPNPGSTGELGPPGMGQWENQGPTGEQGIPGEGGFGNPHVPDM